MKRLKFHRAIVAIAMMLIGWLPSLAHDFEVDGVFYNKTSDNTAAVTYKGYSYDSYSNEYAGDVVIPSSVNYNGINYDVTSIGDNAFNSCSGLTSIEIPNSVTSIGDSAFCGCSSLTSVIIGNSVTSIGDSAFCGCSSLTSIQIPNSVTSIGLRAFSFCESLTSIVVDSGNTKYDSRNGCNAIIETASNTLIAGCQNTIIPNSVTSIGGGAFQSCTSLTSIQIPNSVTSIGDFAFSYCSSLTSIQIPNSVTSIEYYAFCGCSSLTSIQIPNSVTSIGDFAFWNCTSLTSIEIPNSVTSIGYWAFNNCSSLTSIEIPNSVTSIGEGAFYNCSRLTKITCLATNPPTINYDTFKSYSAELYVPAGRKSAYESANYWYKFSNIIELEPEPEEGMAFEYGGLTYKVTVKGKELAVIASESGEYSGAVVIPLSVDYNDGITYSVTSIGGGAFSNCTEITDVKIPQSVTSIGNNAFWGCTGITTIIIPHFVLSIGDNAFAYCNGLTKVSIGFRVKSIGAHIFQNCPNLNSVYWLATDCSDFTDHYLAPFDDSVTYFYFGDTVEHIPAYLCNGLNNLTSIEIPQRVTSVGNGAFFNCLGLTKITCLATNPPTISADTFSNYEAELCVPTGCKVEYESVEYWKNFTNIIELPTLATSITLDKTEISLEATETATLVATVLPELTTNKSVTWTSSNEAVATVDEYGVATAIAVGEATITATTNDGSNLSVSCKVIVNPTLATSITLDNTEVELEATQTATLVATVLPELTTDKSVTWTSSNEEVATVDEYGVVTAIAVGEATITATTNDGTNLSASCKVIVNPTLATSITLDNTEVELEATQTVTLVATVLPELTTNKSVSWSSSNESIATVDEYGVVTAIAVGEATITATTNDGTNLSASCKVIVNPTLATSIILDKTEVELEATQTATLVATVLPELTTNKSVTWTSSNEAVATVDANGVVTAIALGEAVITATTTDGSNLLVTCKVTVVPTLAETITLDKTEISIEATETATLVATVLPELTTNKSVTWKSSNEAVATVDANGVVTAIALGEAVITATTTDGSNLSEFCKVTVVPTLATSIELDKTEISLEATETATLIATVLPELTTDKSVEWSSSDETVVVVDENGVVTAVAVGEATIVATTVDDSNLSATCKVTVIPTLATSIELDKTEISLEATETATLVATVLPETTSNKSVEWKSSNEAVATVNNNGEVTAIAVGEAIITAITTDGTNLSATCKVTVVPTLAVSIEVTPNSVEAEENSEVQLSVNVLPENATYKSVEWTSSNDAIASVDANGLVKIYKEGNVVITATTTDGTNLSATCSINVYSGINGVNGNDVIVATIGDNILVKNAPLGSNVRVYAADGAMIATEIVTDGSVVIEAPIKGIYVVVVDNKSFKVMVK